MLYLQAKELSVKQERRMSSFRIIDVRQRIDERTMLWHAEALRLRSEIVVDIAETILEELLSRQTKTMPAPKAD